MSEQPTTRTHSIVGELTPEQAALLGTFEAGTESHRANQEVVDSLGAGALLGSQLNPNHDTFAVVVGKSEDGSELPLGYVKLDGDNKGDMTYYGRGYARQHDMPEPSEALVVHRRQAAERVEKNAKNNLLQKKINLIREPMTQLSSMRADQGSRAIDGSTIDVSAITFAEAALRDHEHPEAKAEGAQDALLARAAISAGAIGNIGISYRYAKDVIDKLQLTDQQRVTIDAIVSDVLAKKVHGTEMFPIIERIVGSAANQMQSAGFSSASVNVLRAFGVGATLTPDLRHAQHLYDDIEKSIRRDAEEPKTSTSSAPSGLNMS